MPETLLDQAVAASAAWTDVLYVVADPTGTPADKQITKEALFEAALKALAGLTPASNKIPYFSSGSAAGLVTIGSGLTFSGGTLAASGGSGAWGGITGTLADQTDLASALAAKQPLDADLTAIAALTTDAFGRVLLTKTTGADVRDYIFAMQRISWGNYSGDITSQTGAGANMDATAASRTVTLNSTPDTCGILAVRCASTSGTNTVTITASGGWTIDGAASITLSQAGEFVVLEAVNADSKWRIISDGRYGTRPLKWATVSASGTRAAGYVYDCSGTNTQTLPVATAGETIGFCLRGTPGDVVTIAPSGGGTVGGSSSITLTCVASSVREFVLLSARASNEWEIVADGRRSIANGQLVANTARLLGRGTAGVGVVEELTVGTGLSLSGGALACTVSGGLTKTGTKTAAYTAVNGDLVLVSANGAGANFAVSLPASPANNDRVGIVMVAEHATRKVTVSLNGGSFVGTISYYDLILNGDYVVFQYDSTLGKWFGEADGIRRHYGKLQRATAQSISSSSNVKILGATAVHDIGGIVDTTNSKIAVRRAGLYRISCLGSTPLVSATACYSEIWLNGSNIRSAGITVSPNNDTTVTVETEAVLAAGDYLEQYYYHNSSGSQNTYTNTDQRPELIVREVRP